MPNFLLEDNSSPLSAWFSIPSMVKILSGALHLYKVCQPCTIMYHRLRTSETDLSSS